MKIIKLFTVCLLMSFAAKTQVAKSKFFHDPGIYLGGNWSRDTKINFVPQVWVYPGDFYIEGRYNYEDEKTYSLHLGYPIEISGADMEVIPTAGFVFGNFKGYAVGLNSTFNSKYLTGFTENEYCFSSGNTNFFFSWAGLTTPVIGHFNVGASWQYTVQPFLSVLDAGPMISYKLPGKTGTFEVQLYSYNTWKEDRYWQFGISFSFGEE